MASRRRVRIAYRLSLALLGLLVAVLQALHEAVKLSRWWDFAVLMAIGVITFLDNSRAILRSESQAKLAESKRKVFRDVVSALSVLAEGNNTSVMHFGASIFVVGKKTIWVGSARWWWPWRRPEQLVRWDRYRLSFSPQPSKVLWTRGKGAVGQAWAQCRHAHRDWRSINSKWEVSPPTRTQFDQMADETKAGLDYSEFLALLGKYSETLAVPMVDEAGNVVGVLSVDVATSGRLQTVLGQSDVTKLLEDTIGLVRPYVTK